MLVPSKHIDNGFSPTMNVPTTLPLLALSSVTVLSSEFATQTLTPSKQIADG